MKDKRRKDNKVSSIQSLIEKRNRELNNEEHLSNHDANHKDKNKISTDDAQLYKINKPNETSKQQDQNQSIDEDNFNNQSNESEQLEQNEAIEQSNETSDENAQNVESTKTNDSHRLSTNSSENTYKLSIKDRVKEFNDNRKRKNMPRVHNLIIYHHKRKEQLRIQRRKRQKEFSTLSLHFSIINNFIFTLHVYTTK